MMGMMLKFGKSKLNTTELKLICDHTCKQHYKFIQQSGWEHHFLPVCSCKDNPYFQIPKHVPPEQYETYMLLSITDKNEILFIRGDDG